MIELLPFEREDFARLIEWVNPESYEFMVQWAGFGFQLPLDDEQLERYRQGYEYDEIVQRRIFKAVDTTTNTVVGHIELNNINDERRTGTICRVLIGDSTLRGKGYGEQMMARMLDFGFKELGLRRIDLYVFDFNTAAIACYQKVGFVKVRYLREIRLVDEAWWSAFQMSVTSREWRLRNAE